MIVILRPDAEPESVQRALVARGLWVQRLDGSRQTQFAIEPCSAAVEAASLLDIEGVLDVVRPASPHPKLDRAARSVRVGAANFEAERPPVLIAGPCSVESEEQIHRIAREVARHGAKLLRGGAYKPRTSPYSFQGMGVEGLEILAEAREQTGLAIVTEVMAPDKVDLVSEYADVLQIGARNMQNYALLLAVGKSSRPVLLKRGMMSTIEELLMSAEYILSAGNYNVMLCERGIRTFETYTRNTTDINAIPALKHLTHLPVIGDPSHGTGRWPLVAPVARALVAAGADGLIIEVHHDPEHALSDGAQSLKPERFAQLVRETRLIAEAVGRTV